MKKFLLILIFFALSLSFPLKMFAQAETQVAQTKTQYPLNTNPDVPQNFHTYTQNVFIEILASAVCITAGVDVLSHDGKCLGIDPSTKKIGYVDSSKSVGLASIMGDLIGGTYNLPASSGTYVRYMASNFGITHTTYAAGFGQGIGFEGLTPVLQIWKVFRNLSYMVFVLIFMVIGLGIMFRINIDARTVMTIQNQIPKIIIALVLITMSYAIAGFLIDMMYLTVYLLVHVFDSQKLATVTNMSSPFQAIGSFGGASNIAAPTAESVSSVFRSIFDGTFGGNLSKIVTTLAGAILGGTTGGGPFGMIGKLVGGGLGALAGQPQLGSAIGGAIGGYVIGGVIGASKGPDILQFVAGIIVYLIVIISIFTALWRTWVSLVKAYVFILLDVIFAPFFIMGGLLPGSPGGGFGSWIRSMLGNLAAFPTVLALFLIGATIQSSLSGDTTAGNFIPPLVGNPGDDSAKNIGSIIGLGIILIMPESVALAKAAFKSPERKLASSAFHAVGAGYGFINKPVKSVRERFFGEDKFGNPRQGRKWLETKYGRGVGFLLGGGTHTSFKNEDGTPGEKLSWLPFRTKRAKTATATPRAQGDAVSPSHSNAGQGFAGNRSSNQPSEASRNPAASTVRDETQATTGGNERSEQGTEEGASPIASSPTNSGAGMPASDLTPPIASSGPGAVGGATNVRGEARAGAAEAIDDAAKRKKGPFGGLFRRGTDSGVSDTVRRGEERGRNGGSGTTGGGEPSNTT